MSGEGDRRPARRREVSLDARRERAAGRIVEDERLRGQLEDDAFAPLQAWALDWVDAYARSTAGLGDADAEAALEAGIGWARAQLTALVALLDEWSSLTTAERAGRLERLAPTFPAPLLARRAGSLASVADPVEASRRAAAALPVAPG